MHQSMSSHAVSLRTALSLFVAVGLTILTSAPRVFADGGLGSAFPIPQAAAALSPMPISNSKDAYWKKRPELLRKIREERSILVSVRESTAVDQEVSFTMLGVGIVNRTKDFSFRTSQEYGRLPQVSDHFKMAEYAEKSHQLLLVVAALGFESRMILRILPAPGEARSELQWEVIDGRFKGLKGLIGYEVDGDNKTEMSLDAHYKAQTLPLPKSLMGLALEIIIQKVAEKMRSFIEAETPQR